MEAGTDERIRSTQRRHIEDLRAAIETAKLVIEANRRLGLNHPSHRASAEQRVIDGEAELATLEAEFAEAEAELDGAGLRAAPESEAASAGGIGPASPDRQPKP